MEKKLGGNALICNYCGHTNQPGVKFCSKCGAQFPVQAQEAAPPPAGYYAAPPAPESAAPASGIADRIKSLPIKKILTIAIPVIVVIIAAIIFIPMLIGPGAAMVKDHIEVYDDGDRIIVSGNNNARFIIDGEYFSEQCSLDGSKVVVLADYDGEKGGTLWLVTTSNYFRIAEDVLYYVLADSGNGVAYQTDYDRRHGIATLYLYNVSSKSSAKISEDAKYSEGICISPNGKTVSFISDLDDRDNDFYGYISIDGKASERIGQNMYAVAISDGARHMYYIKITDGSRSLHVRSGQNDNRLITDLGPYYRLMLNRDYSQAVFNMDDKAYITINGGERERIGGKSISRFVLPRGTQQGGNHSRVTVYGIRNFANNVVINDDGLAYINKDFDANRINSSSDHAWYASISENGRTLLFINNNGHLSSIDPTQPNAERVEIGRNVEAFAASNNAKLIYFVNEDEELFCVKGNGAPFKISDDVYSGYLGMSYTSNRVFFLVDFSNRRYAGELYYSNNGGVKTKVAGAGEVMGMLITPTNVFYMDTDNAIYRSNGNERFALFVDDLEG